MPVPTPSAKQLAFLEWEFGLFFHFGINTFHDKEWSDGTLPAQSFQPTGFDPRQWMRTAKDAGARYVVLTAKHHDGFCLWPTDTTDYSVRSSPWRGGKGDVVGEAARACREAGLAFGLYLSPWDRHEPSYADKAAYDAFYARQLRELLTRYGPVRYVWFDGAGSEGRVYDFARFDAIVSELQPDAVTFNMGRADVRWAGNEDGLAPDPNTNVVKTSGGERFAPAECDVPIRRNWFWHTDDLPTLKSLEHLQRIYHGSIGRGANLLLNVAPDRSGRLPDPDVARLRALSRWTRTTFAKNHARGRALETQDNAVTVDLGAVVSCEQIAIRERLERGQHVRAHRVLVETANGAGWQTVAEGTTIGRLRIWSVERVPARRVRVEITDAVPGAEIADVAVFGG